MGSYLHRIAREKENEPQNDLVREFSLQVIHESISITANGFFNVDFDLLGSVCDIHKLFRIERFNFDYFFIPFY